MGNLAKRLCLAGVGMLAFPLLLSVASAQALREEAHPDENLFQYRVKNYVVQRPWIPIRLAGKRSNGSASTT
jgi:hypothetical protein